MPTPFDRDSAGDIDPWNNARDDEVSSLPEAARDLYQRLTREGAQSRDRLAQIDQRLQERIVELSAAHVASRTEPALEPAPRAIDDSGSQLSPTVNQVMRPALRFPTLRRWATLLTTAVVVIAFIAVFTLSPGQWRSAGPGLHETPTGAASPTTSLPGVTPLACGHSGPANPSAPSGTLADHSVLIDRQVSAGGITIVLDRAYADPIQTVVSYRIQSTSDWGVAPSLPVLIDEHGNRYAEVTGDGSGIRGNGSGVAVFAPLPPAELGTPQRLTFFAQQMTGNTPTTSVPPAPTTVNGPWQISFSLTPVSGTSVALSTPPVTRHGVTVQPLRIDTAPAGGGLDGMAGGARVLLRISGLSSGTTLSDLVDFDYKLQLPQAGLGFYCQGGILELVQPGGEQLAPSVVYALGQTVALVANEQQPQTVGFTGTAELEVLFYLPIPSVRTLILYMDRVSVEIPGAAQPKQISGPWEFRL